MAPNFNYKNKKSFQIGPTTFSILTMNIVLNVIVQHGCKRLAYIQNVLIHSGEVITF